MIKHIGIITAEDEEFEAVKNIMKKHEEIIIHGLKILIGEFNNKNYVLTKSGVGKVNAARTAQILIDKFDTEYIINVGSAGALDDKLNIGDIVIGSKLVQHDFDVTAFGREKGYISGVGKFFESDLEIIKKAKGIKINDINIVVGTIASGDIFCTDVKMKEKIRKEFNADCVEMEGAAIAQVCFLNKVPFIIIRSISDIPNNNNQINFKNYIKMASKNCAEFISYI